MRPTPPPLRPLGPSALAALVALILLATACSGDQEEGGAAPDGDGSAIDAGGVDESGPAGSPLSDFLGQDAFGVGRLDQEAQERYLEAEREREQAIASCMADAGFEYVPVEPIGFGGVLDETSRDYAATFGYGISTERFSQDEVGPELVGFVDDGSDGFADDPNIAIVEALDEPTRLAYSAALWGDESQGVVQDDEVDGAFEPTGCYAEAEGVDAVSGFYQDFASELQALYTDIEADDRLAEQQAAVVSCVADAGFDLDTTGTELYDAVYDLLADDLDDIETEFYDAEAETGVGALSDQAKSRLGELQATETAIAVAVWDCGGSDAAVTELYREVAADYEQRFLDTYAERLEPYRAEG